MPSKNEESNIARCLDSIIQAKPSLDTTEIILVDCASDDKTISIAKNYPINILQLKPGRFHSAAAARYVGTHFASGKFIFFIDADMTLENGFLEKAMDILNKDPTTVAVGGIGKEIYLQFGNEIGSKPNLYNTKNEMQTVHFLGGAALYRRDALIVVGGFNPYLRAAEENELAQRLRKRKYCLISVPFPMITHYTASVSEWQEFRRKRTMNLFIGIGESIRLSHSFAYLAETLLYYKEFTLFLLFIIYASGIVLYSLISALNFSCLSFIFFISSSLSLIFFSVSLRFLRIILIFSSSFFIIVCLCSCFTS